MEGSMLQSLLKWPSKESIDLSVRIAVYRPNASDDVVCCIQQDNAPSGELRGVSQIYSLLSQSLQSDKPVEPALQLECVQSVAQHKVDSSAQHSPVDQSPADRPMQPIAEQSEDCSTQSDLIKMWKCSNLGLPIASSSADPGTLHGSLFHLK